VAPTILVEDLVANKERWLCGKTIPRFSLRKSASYQRT